MKTNKLFQTMKSSILILACLIYCSAFSQNSANDQSHTLDPSDPGLTWHPAPPAFPGASVIFLNGEINKPRLDFFFRVDPGVEVVRHTHKSAERMILVQGELEVQYDGEDPVILKPGMYAHGPAKKPHKAKCNSSDHCILFVAMNEPFTADPLPED